MAVPTINHLSIESHFMNFDDHLSRWSSSSSLCTSSSASRSSSSSTGYPDCPAMSKSLTDSMSSDTQTENETPPESPNEASSHMQSTPVFHEAKHRHMSEYPHRPDLSAYVSAVYSESGEEYDGSDAGYETECEDKHPILHAKRSTTRRKVLDRTSLRRRGELYHGAIAGSQTTRPLSGGHTPPPSAPLLGTSTRIAGQSTSPSPSRRGSISRPGGPTLLELPKSSAVVFPSATGRSKAPIGLGLGLGLPSTLSEVRRSPNCVHRSNTDSIPPSQRSLVPVTHSDLLLPLDFYPLPPTPLKPRLNPISLSPTSDLSPLDLESSSTDHDKSLSSKKITPLSDSHAMPRPRHAAFCFSHGDGKPTDFCTTSYGATAAAFLTMANHAQTQEVQIPGSRRRMPKGPPSRGSPLASMQEEACPGDEARGIRRFAAMNPYFATMGYCVTSG